MPDIDWLLQGAEVERALHMSQLTTFDDSHWRARIERVHLDGGLRVFLTQAEFHQDLAIEARDDRTDFWIGGQVTIGGGCTVDFLDSVTTSVSVDRAMLFRPGSRRAAFRHKAGGTFHSVGFALEIGRVARLLRGEEAPSLAPLLEPTVDATRLVAFGSDRVMRNVAAGMFARGLNGPLRALMLEAATIQLLAFAVSAAGQKSASKAAPARAPDPDAIHAARRLLLSDMARPPGLAELAERVGLTEKQLNAGFRAQFGTTVFEALRNERLEHARHALLTGKVGVKEAAFRVGYNYVSNFINAFTRRYGAPPRRHVGRAYRKKVPQIAE